MLMYRFPLNLEKMDEQRAELENKRKYIKSSGEALHCVDTIYIV